MVGAGRLRTLRMSGIVLRAGFGWVERMTGVALQLVFLIGFCAYIGGIYHLSVILLCRGSSWRRQLYWALPLAVSALFSWLMVLITRASKVEPEPASYSMYLILLLGPFALQLAMASFVFRCESCGWLGNTYRTWWRKGAFWCPHCNAHYQDGKRRPE